MPEKYLVMLHVKVQPMTARMIAVAADDIVNRFGIDCSIAAGAFVRGLGNGMPDVISIKRQAVLAFRKRRVRI